MIQFTAWPEMLAWPYLVNLGWLPYKDIAIAHTPLLVIALAAWYQLFGVGLIQLQLFTWIVTGFTAILLFSITHKIRTVIVYLSLWAAFGGNGIWFDLALAPLSLLLYKAIQNSGNRSGILFGLMLLVKQTAIWFLLPIFLVLKPVRGVNFLGWLLIVLATFLIALTALGILDDFYAWAVNFGLFILPRSYGQIVLPSLRQLVTAAIPFIIFVLTKGNTSLIPWAIAGSLGTYPRWEWFHLQPALPFLALGISKSRMSSSLAIVFSLMLIIRLTTSSDTRFFEPEFLDLVASVESATSPGDRVFILNAWDHIYPLTNTQPAARPLIPHLPWYMDQPGIQDQIVSDLDSDPPSLVVVGDYDKSTLGGYKPEILDAYLSTVARPESRIGRYTLFRVQ